jgi:hypothetical protein
VAAGLPLTSVLQVVEGLATSNLTLAETAPGVTPIVLEAGGAAALKAVSMTLRTLVSNVADGSCPVFGLAPICLDRNDPLCRLWLARCDARCAWVICSLTDSSH